MQKWEASPLSKEFISFFLKIWGETNPLRNETERQALSPENLLNLSQEEIKRFQELSKHGEYSIRFLILLARLLMLQEKTNRADAYMFRDLLEALKENKDLFSILSKATHRGR